MKRPQIYFTSDWHIGHHNVLKFSNRPFQDVTHMQEVLINNYNSVVPDNGICYFLGDMGLGNSKQLMDTVKQLNGTKIMIVGNHDKGLSSMLRIGFDLVIYGATLQISKERVTLTHCPLLGVTREDITNMRGSEEGEHWHGESRHRRFSTWNHGQFHLHGHIHSPNGGVSTRELGRQYDVGVDANNYRPVSISCIESWITKVKESENE